MTHAGGRPRKWTNDAERMRANRRKQGVGPRVRKTEAEKRTVRVKRERRRDLEAITEWGLDALAPGTYWLKKLCLIEGYLEALWSERTREPTVPLMRPPLPDWMMIERAREILKAEKSRIRAVEAARFGCVAEADKRILEVARSPERMREPVYSGLTERWGWANPKRPMSDYPEDLREIEKSLRYGLPVRFSWEPKTKPEPESGSLTDTRNDLKNFERDYAIDYKWLDNLTAIMKRDELLGFLIARRRGLARIPQVVRLETVLG